MGVCHYQEQQATKSIFREYSIKAPWNFLDNLFKGHYDIGLGYEDEHARCAGYDAGLQRKFIIDYLTFKIDWYVSKGFPFMEDTMTGEARVSGILASLACLEKALETRDNY